METWIFMKTRGGAFSSDVYANVLFQNPGHGNHWIKLKLEGVQSNRAAIGARLKLTLNIPSGMREIHRTVSTGSSFGANPLRQEIGLGTASMVERLEIVWPVTGKTQVVAQLPASKFFHVKENAPGATELPLKSFKFQELSQHHHHH
jgi:hypothetical protein